MPKQRDVQGDTASTTDFGPLTMSPGAENSRNRCRMVVAIDLMLPHGPSEDYSTSCRRTNHAASMTESQSIIFFRAGMGC